MKRILLILLFILIIIAAHPFGAIRNISYAIWPYLHAFGIDVGIVPFTCDMTFMYDVTTKTNLYSQPIEVVYKTKEGDRIISYESLPLYGWRVPALLFSDEYYHGGNTSAHLYALCQELKRKEGQGEGFIIRVNLEDRLAYRYGLNQFYSCH